MVHTSVLMHWPTKVPPTGIDLVTFPKLLCVHAILTWGSCMCMLAGRVVLMFGWWCRRPLVIWDFNFLGRPEVNTIYTLFNAIIHVVIVSLTLFVLSLFYVLLQAYTILSIRGMPLVLHSSHLTSRSDIKHKNSEVLPDNLELHKSCLTTGIPRSTWSLSSVLECWRWGSWFLMTCTPIHSLDNDWSSPLAVCCTTLSACIATPVKCFMHGKDKTWNLAMQVPRVVQELEVVGTRKPLVLRHNKPCRSFEMKSQQLCGQST